MHNTQICPPFAANEGEILFGILGGLSANTQVFQNIILNESFQSGMEARVERRKF